MNHLLPLFPDDVIEISDGFYITKKHLRQHILEEYYDLASQYCISKTFNIKTGKIERKFAWHSILEALNDSNKSKDIIEYFNGLGKKKG
jgi:hypothetical protein